MRASENGHGLGLHRRVDTGHRLVWRGLLRDRRQHAVGQREGDGSLGAGDDQRAHAPDRPHVLDDFARPQATVAEALHGGFVGVEDAQGFPRSRREDDDVVPQRNDAAPARGLRVRAGAAGEFLGKLAWQVDDHIRSALGAFQRQREHHDLHPIGLLLVASGGHHANPQRLLCAVLLRRLQAAQHEAVGRQAGAGGQRLVGLREELEDAGAAAEVHGRDCVVRQYKSQGSQQLQLRPMALGTAGTGRRVRSH
mmetsp:Transcript_19433/g.73426  ORF Transcript_19433/g.73426 Transcript_19433/m.73426 type:complete len:252 (-) Transcript_19433:380-1135(-)